MYYMDLDDFHLVSSSPEILARVEDGVIVNRPLAGTRRRGHTEAEDKAMEAELLGDPKEIAEHLMLIDLGRNDVGRVARDRHRRGHRTVHDRALFGRHAHLEQRRRQAESRARPRSTCCARRCRSARCPAPPKSARWRSSTSSSRSNAGVYGGAVGYLAWNGNMDTAIAIRTAVVKDGKIYIEAGAGVVADSIGRLEWKETMNKARAIFRAAAMAERRFKDLNARLNFRPKNCEIRLDKVFGSGPICIHFLSIFCNGSGHAFRRLLASFSSPPHPSGRSRRRSATTHSSRDAKVGGAEVKIETDDARYAISGKAWTVGVAEFRDAVAEHVQLDRSPRRQRSGHRRLTASSNAPATRSRNCCSATVT